MSLRGSYLVVFVEEMIVAVGFLAVDLFFLIIQSQKMLDHLFFQKLQLVDYEVGSCFLQELNFIFKMFKHYSLYLKELFNHVKDLQIFLLDDTVLLLRVLLLYYLQLGLFHPLQQQLVVYTHFFMLLFLMNSSIFLNFKLYQLSK